MTGAHDDRGARSGSPTPPASTATALAAASEMVEGGPIDVLTGDYLAELTMLILWKARQKDPTAGYARTGAHPAGARSSAPASTAASRSSTTPAGSTPAGLARELAALAGRLGLHPKIAYVTGDDLLPRLKDLQAAGQALANLDTGQPLADAGGKPVTANAYLGGWGITAALGAGADIVVCPRVTDASLVTGPAAWWHGWRRDDFDQLAGAVAAGHVIECGPQATGGNYSYLDEITDRRYPGFPIAEVAARRQQRDHQARRDRRPGLAPAPSPPSCCTRSASRPTLNPDVVAHFDTVTLDAAGPAPGAAVRHRGQPAAGHGSRSRSTSSAATATR